MNVGLVSSSLCTQTTSKAGMLHCCSLQEVIYCKVAACLTQHLPVKLQQRWATYSRLCCMSVTALAFYNANSGVTRDVLPPPALLNPASCRQQRVPVGTGNRCSRWLKFDNQADINFQGKIGKSWPSGETQNPKWTAAEQWSVMSNIYLYTA